MKKYTLKQLLNVVNNMEWYGDKEFKMVKTLACKFEVKSLNNIINGKSEYEIIDILDKSDSVILSFAIKDNKYVKFIADYISMIKLFRTFEGV